MIIRIDYYMSSGMSYKRLVISIEPPPPSSKASKHYEDIEAARKRKARAEENTSRSSRMIYVLNQQVKNIQGDLDRMQRAAGAAKPLKKVQISIIALNVHDIAHSLLPASNYYALTC